MGTNTSALRGPTGAHVIDAATDALQNPNLCEQATQVSTDAVGPAGPTSSRNSCAHERGHSAACTMTCLVRQGSLKLLETLNNWRLGLTGQEKTASSLFSTCKLGRSSSSAGGNYSSYLQRNGAIRRCYSEGELNASEEDSEDEDEEEDDEDDDAEKGRVRCKSLTEAEPDVLAHIGSKLSSASIPRVAPAPVPPVTMHLAGSGSAGQVTVEEETQTATSVATQATAMCMMATQTPGATPRRPPLRAVNAARNARLPPSASPGAPPPSVQRGRRPMGPARDGSAGGRQASARGRQSNTAPNYTEIVHTATSIQSLKQALAKAK